MKGINRVQLRAMALLVGLSMALAARAAEVVWVELRLEHVAAAGVPEHRYRFNGMLKVYGGKDDRRVTFGGLRPASPVLADATIRVDGWGTWDAVTKQAQERLRFGGSEQGTLLTQLRCDQDPWLHAMPCAVVGAVYNSRVEQSYDWPGIMHVRRVPLTQSAARPATAKSFPTLWLPKDISGGVSVPTQE